MNAAIANSLALVGFGEVGATLYGSILRDTGDLKVSVGRSRSRKPSEATRARLETYGLRAIPFEEALLDAEVVVSAVAPTSALGVAQDVAQHLKPGCLYVDMNSVSGPTMKQIATVIEGHGGRCVDAAIMGPVPLMGCQVPIVLSGTPASEFHVLAKRLGLNTSVLSMHLGDASSLKMLWSIITKGTIALLAESLIAAHRLGLFEPLRELLAREYGNTGSDAMLLRMLGSTVKSGARRLGEMDEARKTIESASVPVWTTESTRLWIQTLSGMAGSSTSKEVFEMVQSISDQLGSTDRVR